MKKILRLISLFLLITVSSYGQHEEKFTIQPKIGLDYSKLATKGDRDNYFSAHLMGGVEGQYDFTDRMGLALGVLYADNTYDYKDYAKKELVFLQIPITLNIYLAPGFSLKFGPQFGYLLKAKENKTPTCHQEFVNGTWRNSRAGKEMYSIYDDSNKFNISANFGLSYEWKNIVLDGRFVYTFSHLEKYSTASEQYLGVNLTLGYRFEL